MKQLGAYSFSLPGGREVNEDAVRSAAQGKRLMGVVADGLGGQGGGDIASRVAADEAMELLQAAPRLTPAMVRGMMEQINSTILAEQIRVGCKMMSTLAIAAIQGRRVLLAHLGDTRVYRFRGGRMMYCSHDHSVTQKLADGGEITREEMRTHETRNLLLQSLGQLSIPNPEIQQGFLRCNERLLLCTDGFWEKFSDGELARAMAGESPETVLEGLKTTALSRAGEDSDNISALLIG